MRSLVLAFVFSVLLVYVSCKEELDLTDSDFSTRIQEHETVLVMFYAPWCGHCKKLKPEYTKAASLLVGNDPPITLAKVDCTEAGKETCNKHSVSGYPTLKIFRNGEMWKEYNGPREAHGIVKYMRSQVEPASKELTSVEDLKAFISKDEHAVIGFFAKESGLKGVFLKLADKLKEKYRFAHTSNSKVLEEQKASDHIIIFRAPHLKNKFEEPTVTYSGKDNDAEVMAWISSNLHGLVGHRTRENQDEFKAPYVIAYYAVDYVKNPKGSNYWRNRILKVAQNFKDDFTFAISAKDDFQHELNEYGLDFVPTDKPVILARSKDSKKYILKEEFSVETFEDFLQKLKDGELEPYLKSEPIPDDNSGPVITAVAKNFDDVVINNGKDTLVEFYAPWCGHCKKLAPVFDELGEKLKDEDVAIVKMDATANDVPSTYDVRGFPTLFWLPKDSKSSPVRYDGGREVDDFVKYIAKHATNELKGFDRKGTPRQQKKNCNFNSTFDSLFSGRSILGQFPCIRTRVANITSSPRDALLSFPHHFSSLYIPVCYQAELDRSSFKEHFQEHNDKMLMCQRMF
nr:PREDICTED: LOW QUALITY PROTEIN: protein disulfide-isomerase A3 [Bemisia tabaci]